MSNQQTDPGLEALLDYIKEQRGFDFTGYKRPSLTRRVGKRMQEIEIDGDGYNAYRAHLAKHPEEFAHLFDKILINVTAFFRDEIAWDFMREEIVPRIVERRDGDSIRVWSTGCASGEEAYSLAMVFADHLGENEFRRRVKVYATDVDDVALNVGRQASYTAKQAAAVPPEYRERFFDPTNGSYTFRTGLRRSVIFGRHDLVQDPPISRIDLLVCRNTLMYFTADTQEKVLANFHFALCDDGFLFLGKSESLASRTNVFAAIDLKRRVFAKVPKRRFRGVDVEEKGVPQEDQLPGVLPEGAIREAGFEAAPVAQIVVDPEGNVVLANLQSRNLFGLTSRDIGRPFHELEVSFRPVELQSRIKHVYRERHAISLREVEWSGGSVKRFVDVQIAPLFAPTGKMVGVGITFTDVSRYRRLQDLLRDSKREAETANEELQSTVEELETTNEELQSTNEELETTNEELQSSNEELETMNEELQSTNEELETVNDEFHQRSGQLNEASTFLAAVLASLDIGVVVLDRELCVVAWNDGARDLWGLRSDESVGQHFLNLDIGLPVDELRQPIRDALANVDGHRDVLVAAVNRRGRKIACRVRLRPLQDEKDEPPGVILMMQAVEEQR